MQYVCCELKVMLKNIIFHIEQIIRENIWQFIYIFFWQ